MSMPSPPKKLSSGQLYRVTPALLLEVNGGYNPVTPTVLSPNISPGVGNVDEQFQRAPKWSYRLAATLYQAGVGRAVAGAEWCG